ncbi:MAG: TonB C-terminal domain-containing protein, partial [Desulfovibrionaceae bacterium]
MSILSRTLLALCSMALFSTPLVATAHAAAIAAADQGNGYAGQVLEKVVKNWQPPQAAGDYTVRVRARIDGDGKALSCVPEKSSNL